MPTLSTLLDLASFDGATAGDAPTSTYAFALHAAAIVDIVVHTPERVLSIDADRVALLWNGRTAKLIARHELPADAILRSAFVTSGGVLAYVMYAADTLSIRALDDHRVLTQVVAPGLRDLTIAVGAPDLSRVVLAASEELVMVPFGAAEARRVELARHEPEIVSIHADSSGEFRVYVHYTHIAGDMIGGDDQKLFDGTTLDELSFRATFEPFPAASPLAGARIAAAGRVARVTLAGGQLLPDFAGHEHPICFTAWIVADGALLTADERGTIHRWEVGLAQVAAAQHVGAVSMVRFTGDGVVSCTDKETKIWRDRALVATVPAAPFRTCVVDAEGDRVVEVTQYQLRTYSLRDGAHLATHPQPPVELSSRPVRGRRARTTVGLQHAYPVRIVSLRDRAERTLPVAWHDIMAAEPAPLAHAGRLLLSYYTKPTRLVSLETLSILAERTFHEGGTCWHGLHPDGTTLYTAGAGDAQVAAWDFATLTEKQRWTVFDHGWPWGVTAALLPGRSDILVVNRDRSGPKLRDTIRRFALGKRTRPRDCVLEPELRVEALVADSDEARVVVFLEKTPPRVLGLDGMEWVEPRPGEIDAARARRRTQSAQRTAYGLETGFECGEWLVGWSRALSVTALSLVGRAMRPTFFTHRVENTSALTAALVDDEREELWLLTKQGALLRTSLEREEPFETVTTIEDGAELVWCGPSTLAVLDRSGAMHCLRTTGERLCTLDLLRTRSPQLAETAVAHAQATGVRVVTIPEGATISLHTSLATSAVALAPPFVASLHGNTVLRWDLGTAACTGRWTAPTALQCVDVRADGAVVVGDLGGTVTLLYHGS